MGARKVIRDAVKGIREGLQAGNRLNSLQQIADFAEGADSLLALNKFYQPIPFSNISIMLTYAFAQYLIVLGILKQND